MFPAFSSSDVTYRRLTYTKGGGQRFETFSFVTEPINLTSFVIGQFCLPLTFAIHESTFRYSVPDIIALGSKEEVIRTNTESIITAMENTKPLRDFAEMYLPRCTMGIDSRTSDLPITSTTRRRDPDPTPICFADLLPETLSERSAVVPGLLPIAARPTTKLLDTILSISTSLLKGFSAFFTGTLITGCHSD